MVWLSTWENINRISLNIKPSWSSSGKFIHELFPLHFLKLSKFTATTLTKRLSLLNKSCKNSWSLFHKWSESIPKISKLSSSLARILNCKTNVMKKFVECSVMKSLSKAGSRVNIRWVQQTWLSSWMSNSRKFMQKGLKEMKIFSQAWHFCSRFYNKKCISQKNTKSTSQIGFWRM